MGTAARHVSEVSDLVQGQLRRLDSEVQAVRSVWQGAGAASFQALHQRWLEDATKLRIVLGQIGEGLVTNEARYGQAEDAAQQQMNATAGKL